MVASLPSDALAARALALHHHLIGQWGERAWRAWGPPMEVLVATILSQRTTYRAQRLAYRELFKRYGSFEGIARGQVADIEACIAPVTFAERKAPVLRDVLSQIVEQRGIMSIDFLRELPLDDAMAWLTAMKGVGTKTASCVMMFAMQRPAMPVDTHVRRTCIRWGLFGPKTTAERAYRLLNDALPRDTHLMYNFHVNGFRHGQKLCTFERPKCTKCSLRPSCDWG